MYFCPALAAALLILSSVTQQLRDWAQFLQVPLGKNPNSSNQSIAPWAIDASKHHASPVYDTSASICVSVNLSVHICV